MQTVMNCNLYVRHPLVVIEGTLLRVSIGLHTHLCLKHLCRYLTFVNLTEKYYEYNVTKLNTHRYTHTTTNTHKHIHTHTYTHTHTKLLCFVNAMCVINKIHPMPFSIFLA